jgi:hypothetical protein
MQLLVQDCALTIEENQTLSTIAPRAKREIERAPSEKSICSQKCKTWLKYSGEVCLIEGEVAVTTERRTWGLFAALDPIDDMVTGKWGI